VRRPVSTSSLLSQKVALIELIGLRPFKNNDADMRIHVRKIIFVNYIPD